MRILIVGAGATGGYLGAKLIQGGRDVTFLVHQHTLRRLETDGLRIRRAEGVSTTRVDAITRADLDGPYDVVLLAVRSDAVAAAIDDFGASVGRGTRIVPLLNGMDHLSTLSGAFGGDVVLGAAAKLATSLLPDGTIDEVAPGVQLEIGSLDGRTSDLLASVAAEFDVEGINVGVVEDIQRTMWEKFVFITSTAVLTCLAGDVIGGVVRATGGAELATRVLAEVASVAAAEGYALDVSTSASLTATLTDPSSTFGPSMFRDLRAGRPVETSVFTDLAARAKGHGIETPLLDACIVVIDVRANANA